MKRILLFLGLMVTLWTTSLFSYDRGVICAKYRANYGWSKTYRVQATLMSGNELNIATKQYDKYDMFSKYVVIFWAKGQASIIKLDSSLHQFFMSMARGEEGEDQRGTKWKIVSGNLYPLCYGFCTYGFK